MHLRQRAISEGEGRLLQRVMSRFSGSSDVPARRAKGEKNMKVKRRENERIGVFERTEDSTRAMSLNEGLKKKNGLVGVNRSSSTSSTE